MIRNDACVSNVDIKSRSLISSNGVFKNKWKNKKKEEKDGGSTYMSPTQTRIIILITIEN